MQDFEKLLEATQVLHPCVVVDDMKLDLSKQNASSKTYLNRFLSFDFKQRVTQSIGITEKLLLASHALTTCSPMITKNYAGA